MRERGAKFLKILSVELEDLKEDLQFLIDMAERRRSSGELTNYVFLENLGVLRGEIKAVERLAEELARVDPEGFASVEQLLAHLERIFHQRCEDFQFPEAVCPLIKRRMEKIRAYMLTDDLM